MPAFRPTAIPGSPPSSATIARMARDERVLVKSFWQGQEYLYRLVKMLAGGK